MSGKCYLPPSLISYRRSVRYPGELGATSRAATTKDHNRVNKMREWARKELAVTNEPQWLSNLFLFTTLPEKMDDIEPAQLFLDPVWYLPFDDENPVSLLGE